MPETTTHALPLDWNEWRKEWNEWLAAHRSQLRETSKRFKGKNFLADEKLGTWEVNGRIVEFSEFTFPNLTERDERGVLIHKDVRAIGLTFGIGLEGSGAVVHSFAELEEQLGL